MIFLLGVTGTQVLQLFISLSILIVLHEFGHFAAARMFKTRIEKFYLFFDFLFPFANVWNFAIFKKKIGETEYGLGWFPLGGYVKIAGMVDESMDKEQMKLPPQPWEYRSKPAWQRLIIIMGGIIVNFVLGILIFITIMFVWGEQSLPNENAKYGIACDSIALSIGLQNGDKIISVDGKKIENLLEINKQLILNTPKNIKVERNGKVMDIAVSDDYRNDLTDKLEKSRKAIIYPRFPFEITETQNAALLKAGMKKQGEQIVSINDKKITYYDEYKTEVEKNAEKYIMMKTIRDGKKLMTYRVYVPENATIGFMTREASAFLEFKRIEYGFFESIPAGIRKSFQILGDYARSLGLLFDKKAKAYKSLGGFAAMAKSTPTNFDMEGFLIFTGFISIVLAFMNFLPIPMLDGGYVVFILYEMITKRQPSEKFMEVTNYIGMIFLFGLMIYANGNDAYKAIFK